MQAGIKSPYIYSFDTREPDQHDYCSEKITAINTALVLSLALKSVELLIEAPQTTSMLIFHSDYRRG